MRNRMTSSWVRIFMMKILSRVLRWLAPAGTSSISSATPRESSPSMNSSKSQTPITADDETIALTFPDGRVVNSLPELSEWLDAIENDPDTSEMGKQIAWMIASKIRAKLN